MTYDAAAIESIRRQVDAMDLIALPVASLLGIFQADEPEARSRALLAARLRWAGKPYGLTCQDAGDGRIEFWSTDTGTPQTEGEKYRSKTAIRLNPRVSEGVRIRDLKNF